ncbi:MAG TPA: Ada metal-binding domain-containing protein, partial [Polyangiales bacterium]
MPAHALAIASSVVGDPRWALVRARDARADGSFFYSVRTTGVYCRPSCASRPARPENVAFHPTRAAAERAGFRPCKRCRPDQPALAERHAQQVAAMCRLIEDSDETPSLQRLAEHVGLSPFHAQRLFKRLIGRTPRDYAQARREERVRGQLARSGSVTEAIYAAGYNSSGRFYEASRAALGMTPSRYRDGAPELAIQVAVVDCSLGQLLVAASARGVCAIALGDDRDALMRDLARRFPRAELRPGDAAFARVLSQVSA